MNTSPQCCSKCNGKPTNQGRVEKDGYATWCLNASCSCHSSTSQEEWADEFDEKYYGEITKLSDNDLWRFCRTNRPRELVQEIVKNVEEAAYQRGQESMKKAAIEAVPEAEMWTAHEMDYRECRKTVVMAIQALPISEKEK